MAAHHDRIRICRLEKAERDRAAAEQAGRAESEVAHELRQMEHGVEFESDCDQGFGAAAMLLRLMQVTGKFERDGDLRS